jgi:hypothetical protein
MLSDSESIISVDGRNSVTLNPEFRFIGGKNTPSIRVAKGSSTFDSDVGECIRGGVS